MNTPNLELMRQARASLSGKWGTAVLIFFLYLIVAIIAQTVPLLGQVAMIVLSGPFALGMAIVALTISKEEEPKVDQLFSGFSNFLTAFLAYLLTTIFTLLWMLLLIVPGIIAALSYSMTYFIIAENPSISAMDAIDKSKKMMDGFKWKYFRLCLRFVGWALLCVLTLGIGFLWLFPWIQVSGAKFYEEVKANYEAQQGAMV
jgi:uncharacterized membrane protein